jgi:cell division septation protein DedD
MASSQDTEITLGTGKLLVLFFGLVAVCALFFALGYSLGRKSEPSIMEASAAVPQTAPNTNKANGGTTAAPPMTFYKAVEQKDANPELTPATDAKTENNTAPATTTANPAQTPVAGTSTTPTTPDATTTTTLPTAGYFVQVAAVSKQEDADALVDALKKKDYPAFATQSTMDKLFRVQLGPFSDIKDAESMRTRLIADGYSPILKK